MLRSELHLLLSRVRVKTPSEFSSLEEIAEFKKISVSGKHSKYLDNASRFVEEKNVQVIDYFSDAYPRRLRDIEYPPLVLFIRGRWMETELPVAVVGTRYPSGYGYRVVNHVVPVLVDAGFDIVSGMARGIDALCHKVALESEGYTVAVMGSGIDVVYPPENRELYEEIISKGCVISEFPIGTKPTRFNFPYRNRVIAGLSRAVIVIEADVKSGSLITARFGVEQSKPVFSVPGDIFSKRSSGTNKLISEGAFPLCDVRDVLSYFYVELKTEVESAVKEEPLVELNDKERLVLEALGGAAEFDVLADSTGMSVAELSEILFDLEIKGVIKNAGGNRYERV